MHLNFEKYILNNDLLQKKQKVLIACSGGADSMCLLWLMQSLAEKWQLQLAVCHVNHNLRGHESVQDAAFVQKYCQEHELEFELVSVQVKELANANGMSIEQAARQLRYQSLHQAMCKLNCELIATAHNKNDQVETFMINMLRGSGLKGLKGMLPRHGDIIRPLLDTERSAIEFFCAQHNLRYCHDTSNDNYEYLRNRVRNELFPLLKQYNPNIVRSLADNMQNLRLDAAYLDEQANNIANKILVCDSNSQMVEICLDKFNILHQAIATRVVLLAIKYLVGHTQGISRKQLLKILNIANDNSGSKQLKLPHNLLLHKTYKCFMIKIVRKKMPIERTTPLEIKEPGEYYFAAAKLLVTKQVHWEKPKSTSSKLYIPLSLVQAGVIVRSRQSGDHFYLENNGRKAVKNFFIDQKIDKDNRQNIPLVYLGSKLICILAHRLVIADLHSDNARYLVIEYIG